MQWQISILALKLVLNCCDNGVYVNRETVNKKMPVNFTYENKTNDPKSYSKLYIFPASNIKP